MKSSRDGRGERVSGQWQLCTESSDQYRNRYLAGKHQKERGPRPRASARQKLHNPNTPPTRSQQHTLVTTLPRPQRPENFRRQRREDRVHVAPGVVARRHTTSTRQRPARLRRRVAPLMFPSFGELPRERDVLLREKKFRRKLRVEVHRFRMQFSRK